MSANFWMNPFGFVENYHATRDGADLPLCVRVLPRQRAEKGYVHDQGQHYEDDGWLVPPHL